MPAALTVKKFIGTSPQGNQVMRRILHFLILSVSMMQAVAPAQAHAKLLESVPAANSIIASSPREIRLEFNEPITVNLSAISLVTAEGEVVNVGAASANPGSAKGILVQINDSLPAGVYHVRWQTISADMHKLKGDFAFEIRP